MTVIRRCRVSCLAPLILLCATKTAVAVDPIDLEGLEFFERKIRPVLVNHCYECHSSGKKTVKGDYLLDTREGIRKGGASGRDAVIPGDPGGSQLIDAIQYHNEQLQMPPKHQLSPGIVANFTRWIEMGAPDPRDGQSRLPREIAAENHWAWQPPIRHSAPETEDPDWSLDTIDRFVWFTLKKQGLKPNPPADRRTLIRRLFLELTGLPPAPEDIHQFISDPEPDDQALESLVDRLLASDGFGVRWGRHWLDVARYGESSGYSRNMLYPHAWRFRNYVIDSFNEDKPYDQFVMEQIAGDLLPAESVEQKDRQIIATGFLTIGAKTFNEGDQLLFRLNCADDQIDATSRAFLTLTANCSRCHDHKYDPIPAADYYALAGIFLSSRNLAGSETNVRAEHSEAYPLGEDGWAKLEAIEAARKKADETQAAYLELVKERDQIRAPLKEKGIDWKKSPTPELSKAEAKVQAFQTEVKKAREAIPEPPDFAMAVIEGLTGSEAEAFAREQEADKALIAEMKKAGKRPKLPIPDRPKIADSPLYDLGNHKSPLDPVPRGALSLVGYQTNPISEIESGRLQLAEWIVDQRNPLTAKVYVNRIWHHLFGRGLVETVDNFGVLGAEPTHPELLDELALDFVENGWSTKYLVRRIVLSQTWRQSSALCAKSSKIDPENRWLWRFSPQLLEGEAIRDSVLAVSGRLDEAMLETSQVAEISKQQELGRQREIGRRSFYEKDVTWNVEYRSVYLPMARDKLPDMLLTFDAPDPNLVAGARQLTIVPAQALYLLNSDLMIEHSQHTGKRIEDFPTGNRIELAFELILGRKPFQEEKENMEAFIKSGDQGENSWSRIAHILMCSGEFRTIY